MGKHAFCAGGTAREAAERRQGKKDACVRLPPKRHRAETETSLPFSFSRIGKHPVLYQEAED